MKNIIKNFYESENNGFRVLVAPTGLGKTYAWTEAVCDMLSEEQTGENSERSEIRFHHSIDKESSYWAVKGEVAFPRDNDG